MIEIDVYKRLHAADGFMDLELNCHIPKGQFLTIYGESGAGKTSTLRMLAGLLKPDQGSISVDGKNWFDSNSKVNLVPQKRNIGYVFQDYALFPHMTVRQNLVFAGANDQSHLNELIDIVEIGDLSDQKPATLSGGQKQRVAVARALAQRPEILLLDEPLSALDAKIRIKLQDYLAEVHQRFGLTTILISHDVSEIIKLSDQVVVFDSGKIVKTGSPTEVFVNQNISGKFKFTGEILDINKEGIVYVITVNVHNNIVKVIAQEEEIIDFAIGNKVIVASKAFNPIIYKIEE